MSYILDALRRAESERQRGQVPGLGAVPPPQAGVAEPVGSRAAWWTALGLLILGLAAALLWWLQKPTPSPIGAGVEAGLPVPPATAPAPIAAKPAPEPAPVAATAAPLPASPAPAALPMVVSAPPAPAPAVAPMPVATAVQAQPAADKRIVKLTELTPQQRSEWPALGVGGSVWSDSAASRFVILNGQVLREGQAVGPGLTLERIQPRAVLLRWRGLLVELPL